MALLCFLLGLDFLDAHTFPWFDDDEFSVASNRKTNLILTNNHHGAVVEHRIEGKEGGYSLGCFFLVQHSPFVGSGLAPFRGKGKFLGWGHTFDVVLVFLFSLMHTVRTFDNVWSFGSSDSSALRRCCSERPYEHCTVSLLLTLGEQFLTSSLESVSIHTLFVWLSWLLSPCAA